jgi:hypothetical protein
MEVRMVWVRVKVLNSFSSVDLVVGRLGKSSRERERERERERGAKIDNGLLRT